MNQIFEGIVGGIPPATVVVFLDGEGRRQQALEGLLVEFQLWPGRGHWFRRGRN
jgi:hypothetical protein